MPGIRSEYLARTETATFDPRLIVSYKFPTDTAISAAAGQYSYFFQTNPYYFDNNPDISAIGSRKTKPEKARHLALSVEQEIDLFTLKLEGFNNYFYDKPVAYPHLEPDGTYLQGLSTGRVKAHGFEIMLRKDTRENRDGLFGWLSYTYTRSIYKSGLPAEDGLYGLVDGNGNYVNKAGDAFGDRYTTFQFEQRHCLKLIAGYKISDHIITGRFQYYSGFPYTPYTGSKEDTNYALLHPGEHRYVPTTDERNSRNFPSYYQLDMRYTYKINHSWGYVSWYVEVINVFMKQAVNEQKWYWDRPYSAGSNPKLRAGDDGFTVLPNFGVEVKF